MKLSSATFARDLGTRVIESKSRMRVEDKLDPETREKLEQLRRGKGP